MISARAPGELAAVAITVVVMGYAAWDGALWDPRWQLGLHLAAVAAAGGMAWVALAGGRLPRSRMGAPILLLLVAFGVASLTPWNAGLSAQALAAICGTLLVLPAAALALRHRPGLTALAVLLPVLYVAAVVLLGMVSRRMDWIEAGGPGLPPVRMARESTALGSVAVPPFVMLAAAPLTLLVTDRRTRLGLQTAVVLLGVPLAVLSGSRSAWIAIGVSAIVLLLPALVARLRASGVRGVASRAWWQPARWTPRRTGIAFLLVAAAGVTLVIVAPRLTDLRSLLYRGFLWRDTLAAWSSDPLFGIGPGSMPFARQAAAPALSFPVRQPHSHDIPLGILGDAGLLGLAAAVVVAAAFVWLAGPWRTRTLAGRAAFAVLAGCATAMLFEDLTFLPGFSILAMVLAAMALSDAGAISWRPLAFDGVRPRLLGAAGVVAAGALLAIMVVGDASAIAYRQGTDAAAGRDWRAALAALQQSERLNPWQPTGPKAVAVAADGAGLPDVALQAARRAVQLGPGDGSAWTNLAVLCRAVDEVDCARRAAGRAVGSATLGGQELANAALVYESLGDEAAADHAYQLSQLTNLWTRLTLPWPRHVPVGSGEVPELGVDAAELNLLIARRLADEPLDVDDYVAPATRALALAMTGDRAGAEAEVRRGIAATPESPTVWEVAALLASHNGQDPAPFLRVGDVTRGGGLGSGRPTLPALIYDIATFRAYPVDGLVAGAVRLQPDVPWPWALEPYLR